MHVLEPKHIKLIPEEVEKLVTDLNVSYAQLPKIRITDRGLPPNCDIGDIVKIERKIKDGKTAFYYRVVTI